MAKNLLSNTSFRRLDVDAYDPDKYVDGADESGSETPGIGPDEALIKQLLLANDNVGALKAALQNPPLKTKNQVIKDKSTGIVAKVLVNFRASDIPSAVAALSADEVDLLMKYIYKAMELLPDGLQQLCPTLLAWHAHVFNVCGHGGIIRVLCDRNRL